LWQYLLQGAFELSAAYLMVIKISKCEQQSGCSIGTFFLAQNQGIERFFLQRFEAHCNDGIRGMIVFLHAFHVLNGRRMQSDFLVVGKQLGNGNSPSLRCIEPIGILTGPMVRFGVNFWIDSCEAMLTSHVPALASFQGDSTIASLSACPSKRSYTTAHFSLHGVINFLIAS
jgi:hypothetical protein